MAKQTIGEFLATLRKANGFTQQEVADRLGVSNRTISAWECGTVLPDILLLPALAELYGVTTDEILSGERKQAEAPVFSQKTEAKLYKNKIARFTMQAYILTGIFAVGLILFYVGMYTHLVTIAWVSWRWWLLLLYLGLATIVISATILIAFWKSAEAAIDEDDEKYGTFCILLRRRVSLCAYVCATLSFLLTIVTIICMLGHAPLSALFAIILILSFLLFFGGYIIYRRGLIIYGGNDINARLKKDRKFWGRVTLWGLIPLMLGIGVILFFNFWVQDVKTVYYSSESQAEFTNYMETFIDADVHEDVFYPAINNSINLDAITYAIPLSELAKTAEPDIEYDFNSKFTYFFNSDKSECFLTSSVVKDGYVNTYFYIINLLSTKNGSYSVYNLRYYDDIVSIELKDGCFRCVGHSYYDYPECRFIGLGIVVVDIFTCIVICGLKRQKIKIKL